MARVFRHTYTQTRSDGSKVTKETRKWYIDFVDHDGRRRRVPGFTDKVATQQRAAELERGVERRRSGLVDRFAEHLKRPLADHVDEWGEALTAKGGTEQHSKLSANRVRRIVKACKFRLWSDVSASRVSRYLADRRSEGLSAESSNHYLRAFKSFCRWCVLDGRAPDNPAAHLQIVNTEVDRRHDRRAFTDEELTRLIETTHGGSDRFGMTGPDRAMLYCLAVETGLRAGELRSLTAKSFALTADPPTVTVAAGYSKRRREDVLPMRESLALDLREHFPAKHPDALAFPMPSAYRLPKMLRADLAAGREEWISEAKGNPQEHERRAGSCFLAYRDDAGRVLDFHAFRHTFITNLARGGVHPKIAQELARHSTITLTMDRYTHSVQADRSEALNVLPEVGVGRGEGQRATGTYDAGSHPTGGKAKTATTPARGDRHGHKSGEKLGAPLGVSLGVSADGACRPQSAHDGEPSQRAESEQSRKSNDCGTLDGGCRCESSTDGEKTDWVGADLNRRHTDFQSVALPTELPTRKLLVWRNLRSP